MTLHQGAIEAIFLDTMRSMGLEVDRPAIPTSLEISTNEKELLDPQAYPVKVRIVFFFTLIFGVCGFFGDWN